MERVAAALKNGQTSVKKITREKVLNTRITLLLLLQHWENYREHLQKQTMTVSRTQFGDTFMNTVLWKKGVSYLQKLLVSSRESELFYGGKTSVATVFKKIGFIWKKFSDR